MSKMADLHEEWSRDPEYREAYEKLGPEFELSRSVIEARTNASLTQAQLAERMKTTQSVRRSTRKRPHASLYKNAGEDRAGDRHPASNQL